MKQMRQMSDVLMGLKACNLSSGQTALHTHTHTCTVPPSSTTCAHSPFKSPQMKLKFPQLPQGWRRAVLAFELGSFNGDVLIKCASPCVCV